MFKQNRPPSKAPNKADGDELELLTNSGFSPVPDKYALVNSRAMDRRLIHLIDDVTEHSFEQVKNLYDELVEEDATSPIHVVVATIGGDVRSMLGIMNLILLSKTPVYTYLYGETCSAGSWIYLCGHKRFAPKTNFVSFMLHPMEWTRTDNFGNHDSHSQYIQKLSDYLVEFTSSRTSIGLKRLKALVKHETAFFVGEEIFKYGIATDELVDSAFWLTPKASKKASKKTIKAKDMEMVLG